MSDSTLKNCDSSPLHPVEQLVSVPRSPNAPVIVQHVPGTVLTIHPLARLFPNIADSAKEEFARDIQEHGLREPITVIGDQILDGANRYHACRDMGLPFATQEWDHRGSEIDFVVRKNLHRRQLSETQRAIVAADIARYLTSVQARQQTRAGQTEPVPDLPPHPGGRARDKAATMLNVSSGSVGAGQRVLNNAVPDLVEMVRNDEVAVSAAADVAGLPAEEQERILKGGPEAVREASKKKRTAKIARKPPETPAATTVPAEADCQSSEPEEPPRTSDEAAADESNSVDERFLTDLQFETGIPDSPLLAVDAQAARSVHAILEAELNSVRSTLLTRNLSPDQSIVFAAISRVLEQLTCSQWGPCPCRSDRPRTDSPCSDCRGRGYLTTRVRATTASPIDKREVAEKETAPAASANSETPAIRPKRRRADNFPPGSPRALATASQPR